MVVLKRKPGEKEKTYSTIEIQEAPQSFNEAQNSVTIDEKTEIYTGRRQALQPEREIHPEIRKEAKSIKKEKVSSKTKVILAAYLAVAVVLAAIVIATGIAVKSAQTKVNDLESQFKLSQEALSDVSANLAVYDSENWLAGEAVLKYDMVKADSATEIKPIVVLAPIEYKKSTNWFNEICEFFSRLLS